MLEDDATCNSKNKIMQGCETAVQAPTRLQTAGKVQYKTNAANFKRCCCFAKNFEYLLTYLHH